MCADQIVQEGNDGQEEQNVSHSNFNNCFNFLLQDVSITFLLNLLAVRKEVRHNMEIKAAKKKNRRRINQSFDNSIIFRSTCLIQILCVLVSAHLQQNMRDEKIMKTEVEVTTHNGKQESRQMEKDRNYIQMQKQTG